MGFLATSAAIRRELAQQLVGLTQGYATRAAAIAALPVDAFFDSDETGSSRRYRRTAAAPGYVDVGATPQPTKATVGLPAVDNTSDANKPVSTAQQAMFDALGVDMDRARDLAQVTGLRLSTEFTDKGPSFDNAAALQDMLSYLAGGTGRGIMLAPWHSTFAGELSRDADTWQGVGLYGMPGKSVLRSTGGSYGILRMGDLDGVEIDGVGFISDHVSAVEDGGKSLLYNYQRNVKSFTMRRCYFSNPASFTSAFTLYTNLGNANPDYARDSVAEGVYLTENTFENVGRLCWTLMNRATNVPDSTKRMRAVRIWNNRVRRAGAAAPTYASGAAGFLHGMFGSVDGWSEDVAVEANYLEALQGLGIEFACQSSGGEHRNARIRNNTFRDFSNGLHMLSIDDGIGAGSFPGIEITGNKAAGDVTGARHSNLMGIPATGVVENNDFFSSASASAALIRRGGGFQSRRNRYIGVGNTPNFAVLFEAGGSFKSDLDYYENTGTGSTQLIRFAGTASGSQIDRATFKKGATGGLIGNIETAGSNFVRSYSTDTTKDVHEATAVAMTADADQALTATDVVNFNYVRINQPGSGPLTSLRTLTLLPRPGFNPVIYNATTQALVIQGGSTGTYLYPGQIVRFQSNGNNLSVAGSGAFASSYNAASQGLFLGLQRLYQDANGALRSYFPTTGNPNPQAATDGKPVGLVASTSFANLPTTGLTAGQLAYATNVRALGAGGALEPAGAGTGASVTWSGSAWRLTGTNIAAST